MKYTQPSPLQKVNGMEFTSYHIIHSALTVTIFSTIDPHHNTIKKIDMSSLYQTLQHDFAPIFDWLEMNKIGKFLPLCPGRIF